MTAQQDIGWLRRVGRKLALVILGTLGGLALAEGCVRILKPELRDIVDTLFQKHAYRIHANPRSSVRTWTHPHTGEEHLVIHNALGLRQHREFDVTKHKAPRTTSSVADRIVPRP